MGTSAVRARPEVDDTRFPLLSTGFAVALVLDQLWWGGFEVRSLHAVVVLAAGVVLVRPRSVACFAALAAAEVVSTAVDMPGVGSHRLLLLVVAVVVLAHLGVSTLRARRLPDPAAAVAQLAPFLRASLVVVYASSALAKLNGSFLDPTTSCAIGMARGVVWFAPGLVSGPWFGPAAILGTVLVEATLPVLLLTRRTRLVGLVVGAGFHVVLALAGNVPFSAVCLALYVAFLPRDVVERWRPAPGPRVPVAGRGALVAVLAAGWLVGAALGPVDPSPGLLGRPSGLVSPTLGTATRLVVVAAVAAGVVALVRSRRGAPEPPPERPAAWGPVPVLGVVVLVINAMCPYLGLKTDTSFEMFSGLRTEPGAWNHLVVPEGVRVFGAQEPVRVLAATDPGLVARTAGGRIVLLELDRALRAEPGTTAVYSTAADPTPRLLGPLPSGRTVGEWVATFRDLPPPGVSRC